MAFLGFPVTGGAGEMAGYLPVKMKRKDLEEVYDDFSLFSTAKKIKRLDAELPPIMEEEQALPLVYGQQLPEEQLFSSTQQIASGTIKAEPFLPSKDERALVLYKPVKSPLSASRSPSNVFFRVDPDLIASFKNEALGSGKPNLVVKVGEEADASMDEKPEEEDATKNSLSVVPWVARRLPETTEVMRVSGSTNELSEDAMEFGEVGISSMDVDEKGQERENYLEI